MKLFFLEKEKQGTFSLRIGGGQSVPDEQQQNVAEQITTNNDFRMLC